MRGARIAEPAEGAWVQVCAVRVVGPKSAERAGTGEARHPARRHARRAAITEACKAADGATPCTTLTSGWALSDDECTAVEEDGRRTFRCRVSVRLPGGTPTAVAQAEARTRKKACRRARRRACRQIGGDVACRDGTDGWTAEATTGRRRPR